MTKSMTTSHLSRCSLTCSHERHVKLESTTMIHDVIREFANSNEIVGRKLIKIKKTISYKINQSSGAEQSYKFWDWINNKDSKTDG